MSNEKLLTNVHVGLEKFISSNNELKHSYYVSGNYEYYHYLCDGIDDKGWGCGYRTLQTICSWITNTTNKNIKVPTIHEIQNILVLLGDKEQKFLGSRQWIGSFEVCLVIDHLYDIPSKILHVQKGNLNTIVDTLCNHFKTMGSPVMMGGDIDCSSKGIMGIYKSDKDTYLLVVDPHYVGKEISKDFLQKKGWVKWQPLGEFLSSSFYNLCLPQITCK